MERSEIGIRMVQKEDIDEILEIYRTEVESGIATFEVKLPKQTDMWMRIKEVLKHAPWLVAVKDNKVVGYCYASEHNSRFGYRYCRHVSIYVHPDFQSLKIGQLLYSKLFQTLEMQGYKKLIAWIVLPNDRSIHFHQKFGFTKAGEYDKIGYKFDKWLSIGLYEKLLNDKPPSNILGYQKFI